MGAVRLEASRIGFVKKCVVVAHVLLSENHVVEFVSLSVKQIAETYSYNNTTHRHCLVPMPVCDILAGVVVLCVVGMIQVPVYIIQWRLIMLKMGSNISRGKRLFSGDITPRSANSL